MTSCHKFGNFSVPQIASAHSSDEDVSHQLQND